MAKLATVGTVLIIIVELIAAVQPDKFLFGIFTGMNITQVKYCRGLNGELGILV
jgi:hypothetical protein